MRFSRVVKEQAREKGANLVKKDALASAILRTAFTTFHSHYTSNKDKAQLHCPQHNQPNSICKTSCCSSSPRYTTWKKYVLRAPSKDFPRKQRKRQETQRTVLRDASILSQSGVNLLNDFVNLFGGHGRVLSVCCLDCCNAACCELLCVKKNTALVY